MHLKTDTQSHQALSFIQSPGSQRLFAAWEFTTEIGNWVRKCLKDYCFMRWRHWYCKIIYYLTFFFVFLLCSRWLLERTINYKFSQLGRKYQKQWQMYFVKARMMWNQPKLLCVSTTFGRFYFITFVSWQPLVILANSNSRCNTPLETTRNLEDSSAQR